MDIITNPFLGRLERLFEGKWGSRLLSYLLIPLLIIAAVLLPPISGLERVLSAGHTAIGWDGGAVVDPDGTQVTFPADGLSEPVKVKLAAIPRANFLEGSAGKAWLPAAEALPNWLIPKSPLYTLSVRGNTPKAATITSPIPNDAEPYETLDLYTWNEESESWEWVPSQLIPEDDLIEARLDYVPTSLVVMQTNPRPLSVAADLPVGTDVPAEGREALTEIHPAGLSLGADGGIEGDVSALPQAAADVSYAVMPTLRNWDDSGVVRTDLVNNLLVSLEQQEAHIAAIEALVTGNLYAGIDLDYRGVDPTLRPEYTAFVTDLAERLHAQGKRLSVRVEPPLQIAEDRWETYGYDWRALGDAADVVCIPAVVDPRSYAPGGQMEMLLNWAVSEIERSKIQLVLPARSVEKAGHYLLLKGYDDALSPLLGQIQSAEPVALPGKPVNLTMLSERQASELTYDEVLGTYSYQYRDNAGDTRTVWLENAASLGQKMTLAERYHLRGLTLQHLLAPASDPEIWDLARRFQEGAASPSPSSYAFAWKVTGPDGNTVATEQRPLGDRSFSFPAPEQAGGELHIEAGLADRGQPLGSAEAMALSVATATPVATPTPTHTPTPVPTPTPEFTPTPMPTPTPNKPQIVVNSTYNVRAGPGTNYARAGQVTAGQTLDIVAKNPDGTWWQVCCVDGKQVWIKAGLAPAQGPTGAVAVAASIPPAPTPAPQQPSASGAPLPSAPGFFAYGVQVSPTGNLGATLPTAKALGFTWIKFQLPWKYFESSKGNRSFPDDVINSIQGQGLNILASIVKAPDWARNPSYGYGEEGPPQNPQDFADYVGAFAGRFCGVVQAVEVWNEQNLAREWGHEPLDANRFMELQKAAYLSIKAACPQMIVVSGAPTPSGTVASVAIRDTVYLEQMYQAGLKNYSDAVGVHPSGFGNPPDMRVQDAQAGTYSRPSHTADSSFYFRNTMEQYREIMVKYGDADKRLWPTEFGWASTSSPEPTYEYAVYNSEQQQGEYIVRAFQMMRDWGFVGVGFLWNLDYNTTEPGTELAAFGIMGRPAQGIIQGQLK